MLVVAQSVTRREVLAFRVRAQQLDRPAGTLADTAVLDLGVQDTGTDGGPWALALRGVDVHARRSGRAVSVTLGLWVPAAPALRAEIGEQAERLASFRNARLASVAIPD